jgi:hypothetical protein
MSRVNTFNHGEHGGHGAKVRPGLSIRERGLFTQGLRLATMPYHARGEPTARSLCHCDFALVPEYANLHPPQPNGSPRRRDEKTSSILERDIADTWVFGI